MGVRCQISNLAYWPPEAGEAGILDWGSDGELRLRRLQRA